MNSVAHVVGTRRYATNDTSRNNLGLALLTMGEGWHNNHHYFPVSARQGFFWFEPDVLHGAACPGLVGDRPRPPVSPVTEIKCAMRIKDGNLDIGMLRHHLGEVADIVETSTCPDPRCHPPRGRRGRRAASKAGCPRSRARRPRSAASIAGVVARSPCRCRRRTSSRITPSATPALRP